MSISSRYYSSSVATQTASLCPVGLLLSVLPLYSSFSCSCNKEKCISVIYMYVIAVFSSCSIIDNIDIQSTLHEGMRGWKRRRRSRGHRIFLYFAITCYFPDDFQELQRLLCSFKELLRHIFQHNVVWLAQLFSYQVLFLLVIVVVLIFLFIFFFIIITIMSSLLFSVLASFSLFFFLYSSISLPYAGLVSALPYHYSFPRHTFNLTINMHFFGGGEGVKKCPSTEQMEGCM